MNKCKKISILLTLKDQQLSLSVDDDPFDMKNDIKDDEDTKLLPKFPYFCINESEDLSDFLKTQIINEMDSIYGWRRMLESNDIDRATKLRILQTLSKDPEAAKTSITIITTDTNMKNCGDDCEVKDEEADPDLVPLEPEDDEPNIFESLDGECYTATVKITHTISGVEEPIEQYTFYFKGNGENVPEPPTLDNITQYFEDYKDGNKPAWINVGVITKVEPILMGNTFWFVLKEGEAGCDQEPPPPPPAPPPPPETPVPSPPTSTPEQPKPDKIININLQGCDEEVVANLGLYNQSLRALLKEIHGSIVKQIIDNPDIFRKFAPNSNPNSKLNKDSILWIGSSSDTNISSNNSSVGVITSDGQWGVRINSEENTVQLPVGFRFHVAFILIIKFNASLVVKCGDRSENIPIFFGHEFQSSLIMKKNQKTVTFNKVSNRSGIYRLANPNTLESILRDLMQSRTFDFDSDIIKNDNGTKYEDKVGKEIGDSLKSVILEVLNESKKLSGCDCCLENITDIKLIDMKFGIKNITTPGGDSIFKPELRSGEQK
jgi:hypothetical protein